MLGFFTNSAAQICRCYAVIRILACCHFSSNWSRIRRRCASFGLDQPPPRRVSACWCRSGWSLLFHVPMRTSFTRQIAPGNPIGPEHSKKFLSPFAIWFVQAFTQAVEDGMIDDLSLTIALRIIGRGESIGNLILSTDAGTFLLLKFIPLLGILVWGSPKRHTIFCQRNFITCCPMTSESGTASTYLMK